MPCSVIIPAYNCEATISKCLVALENQTVDDFEVIIVDDGSKDQTIKICKSFSNESKKKFELIILNQKNSGPAKARNTGSRMAKKPILVFTDSDCVPSKDWLEQMLLPFSDKDIGGVAGSYVTQNSNKIVARYVGYEIDIRHRQMQNLDYIDFVGTFSAAYRKKIFDSIGGFDESYNLASGEDADLSFRFSASGNKIKFNYDAKVGHHHPDTFLKYFKQKYYRGKTSVKLYSDNSDKLIGGDSYTPKNLYLQLFLTAFSFLTLLFFIFGYVSAIYFFYSLLFLFILMIPNTISMFRYEFIFLFLNPFILLMRNISIILGIFIGLLSSSFRLINTKY